MGVSIGKLARKSTRYGLFTAGPPLGADAPAIAGEGDVGHGGQEPVERLQDVAGRAAHDRRLVPAQSQVASLWLRSRFSPCHKEFPFPAGGGVGAHKGALKGPRAPPSLLRGKVGV